MFRNMKALPKALILAALIAVPVGLIVKFMPEKAVAVAPATPVQVPAVSAQVPSARPPNESTPPLPILVAPAAVIQSEAPVGLTPAGGHDAGLEAVLKAGQK